MDRECIPSRTIAENILYPSKTSESQVTSEFGPGNLLEFAMPTGKIV